VADLLHIAAARLIKSILLTRPYYTAQKPVAGRVEDERMLAAE
jgi:hypothetical protein